MPHSQHHRISSYIRSRLWATRPEDLELIRAIAEGQGDPQAVLAKSGERDPDAGSVQHFGPVAVVTVRGPLFRYANVMTDFSGATSIQRLAQEFTLVAENPDVAAVIVNLDSPGGEANGIHELGEMIFRARARKPVVAYVGGIAASGGYWLASAAGTVVADRTASFGSIGVVMEYWDDRKARENAGEQRVQIVSNISPHKRADPLTDPGRAQYQRMVDQLGAIFVETVARNRNVDVAHVRDRFGGGAMVMAEEARTAGMIDRIGDLQSLIAELRAAASITSEDTAMSTEDKTAAEPMTAAKLRSQHMDAAGEIERAGEAAERQRIRDCFDVLVRAGCLAVHEELQERLWDGVSTGGEVAMEILGKEDRYRQKKITALAEDAQEPAKVGAEDPGKSADETQRLDAAAREIAAFANSYNRNREAAN